MVAATKVKRANILTALIASLGGLVFGYDSGAMSGALLFLKKAFHLTVFQREAMTSIVIIGAMVGSLFTGYLADRFGRRTALLLAASGAILFALGTGFSPNYALFLLFRFLVGVMVGMIVIAAPMYISESSRTRSRGGASSTFQLAVAIGLSASYWGDFFYAKSGNWHGMFGIAAIPAFIFGLLVLFLPDTPRWYFMRGMHAKGEAALGRLYDDSELRGEVTRITTELESTKTLDTGSYRDLLKPGVRVALGFGILFTVFQQFGGINTVTYYSPTVFKLAGFGTSDSILITAATGIITVLATVLGISMVDRVGRRRLIFISLSGMGLAMFLLGLAFQIGPRTSGMSVVTIGSVVLYHVSFSSGMGLMGWVLIPEIFSNRLRARGQSVTRLTNWIANFVVTISFLSVVQAAGAAKTFWIFTAIIIVAFLFMLKMVPETKNRPLESIEKYWEDGRKWTDDTVSMAVEGSKL
ncbi:sugar porter family MFS transporter [Alicyclobacillus mengziensis]|uniref:Sugar porter family MFS transporter n=1 Tax=Alicyclobacillus mengziensis TaxID=2931921 RepID=A0A9X7VZ55_9BACL|nr:sugar porter family MFS transporter [Alicyclobacillus mengziensis]QSO47399.1 sugar porter family MFS transporter [Alicyclobacillus mengziensis]